MTEYFHGEWSFGKNRKGVTQAYIDPDVGDYGYVKVERQIRTRIDENHWRIDGETFEGPLDERGAAHDEGMDKLGRFI